MSSNKLMWTGVAGSVIAAICCFTPALVLLLGGIGLSAWLAWADKLVLPAAAAFIGIAALGFYRLRHGGGGVACGNGSGRGSESKGSTQT
jgi:mercuric ion transport protein